MRRLGWPAALLILGIGTFWAFQRGANDFNVFYEAWRLVLRGEGSHVFGGTPDRFLYAPGFAWLLAPLGLLPRDVALALWCAAKVAALAGVLRLLGPWGPWGLVVAARPALIDFQYGQVNLLILCACVWALHRHLAPAPDPAGDGDGRADARRARWLDGLAWLALAVAALSKIFPLPLLILPWLPAAWVPGPAAPRSRVRAERLGSAIGLLAVGLLPFLAEGWGGGLELLDAWRRALVSRGLPMESHNQSFAAFLHHYLSGEATHVVAQAAPRAYGLGISLGAGAIRALSLLWTAGWLAALALWLARARRAPGASGARFAAVACALLVVPSHLVWKPYFVFAIPAAAVVAGAGGLRAPRAAALVAAFALLNLTGFDFVGYEWGGRLEAASLMLLAHLLLLGLAARAAPAAPGVRTAA